MGFSGFARWQPQNPASSTSGLESVTENIIKNHAGSWRGKWFLSIKTYRSNFGSIPGVQIPVERTMCALTMNDNVFVLLEDPLAPLRTDVIPGHNPTHYRSTFLTVTPPQAFTSLLAQLRARWGPVRQASSSAARTNQQNPGQQIIIDGSVFAIGNDWIIRCGNVIQPGGGPPKGMLIEAEYLPCPSLSSSVVDSASDLISNILTTLLPTTKDAKMVAITISDAQWDDVLWCDPQETEDTPLEEEKDDLYCSGDDKVLSKKSDWTGVERDRRSAFLIIGALRGEFLL